MEWGEDRCGAAGDVSGSLDSLSNTSQTKTIDIN